MFSAEVTDPLLKTLDILENTQITILSTSAWIIDCWDLANGVGTRQTEVKFKLPL